MTARAPAVVDPCADSPSTAAGQTPRRRIILHGDRVMGEALRRAVAVLGCVHSQIDEIIGSMHLDAAKLVDRERSPFLSTLLVEAADGGQVTYLRRIARECAVAALPWALLQRLGGSWAVGPLFLPGQAACFECLVLRTLATSDMPISISSAERTTAPTEPQTRNLAGVVEIAASIAANELSAFVMKEDCSLIGGVWFVGSDPLRLSLHKVLRVPGCPVCSLARTAIAAHQYRSEDAVVERRR